MRLIKQITTLCFVMVLFSLARASTTKASTTTNPGDCDGNGTVTIAEVQGAINMFLGLNTVKPCVDVDNNGSVSIAEVQKGINVFLGLTPISLFPTELVGTWSNSSSSYTFYADGTFTFVSLYWPGGTCVVISKWTVSKTGTATVSGPVLTINTTVGEQKKWSCFVPIDGSPNSIEPISPFSTVMQWSLFGNILTMIDGTTTLTYTKELPVANNGSISVGW